MARHPRHDEIVATIPCWFTTPYPEMEFGAIERPYGVCQTYPDGGGVAWLRQDAVADLDAVLRDVRSVYGDGRPVLGVQGRERDAAVGPVLLEAGCEPETPNVRLAFVGPFPDVPEIQELAVETVGPDGLAEFARLKLMAFADSEDEPEPDAVERELVFRRAEQRGLGRFTIARLGNEAVSILATLEDERNVDVFLLATRVPFRHRRIARRLLRDAVESAGDRWVVIGCELDGRPYHLYRSLGFTDEVYWRRHWTLPA